MNRREKDDRCAASRHRRSSNIKTQSRKQAICSALESLRIPPWPGPVACEQRTSYAESIRHSTFEAGSLTRSRRMASFKTTLGRTEVPAFQRWTGCGSAGPGPGEQDPLSSLGSPLALSRARLFSVAPLQHAERSARRKQASGRRPEEHHAAQAAVKFWQRECGPELGGVEGRRAHVRTQAASPRSTHLLERDLLETRKRLADAEKVAADRKQEAQREVAKLAKEKQSWRKKALEARSEADKASAERRKLQQQIDQLLRMRKQPEEARRDVRLKTPGKRRETRARQPSMERLDGRNDPKPETDPSGLEASAAAAVAAAAAQSTTKVRLQAKRLQELEALCAAQKVDAENWQAQARAAQLELVAKDVEIADLHESAQDMERSLAASEGGEERIAKLERENEMLKLSTEGPILLTDVDKTDISALEAKVASLKQLLAEKDSENESLSQQLEVAKQSVQEAELLLESYPRDLSRLRQQAVDDKEVYDEHMAALRTELEEAKSSCEKLSEGLESVRKERDQALGREASISAQRSGADSIKVDLEEDLKRLHEELQGVTTHAAALEREVDSAERRADSLEGTLEATLLQNTSLRYQLELAKSTDLDQAKEIEGLLAEKDEQARLVLALTQFVEDANAIHQSVAQENRDLRAMNDEAEDTVHELANAIDALTANQEKSESKRNAMLLAGRRIQTEHDEVVNVLMEMESEYSRHAEESSRAADEARNQGSRFEERLAGKSEEIANLQKLSDQLELDAEAARRASDESLRRCAELEEAVQARDAELQTLKGGMTDLQESIAEKDVAMLSLADQVERLLGSNRELTDTVTTSKDHMAALEKKVQEGQAELETIMNDFERSQVESEQTRRELQSAREKCQALEHRLGDRESSHTENERILSELRTTLAEKDEAIHFMGEQVTELLQKDEESQKLQAEAKESIVAFLEAKTEAENLLKAQDDDMAALRADLSNLKRLGRASPAGEVPSGEAFHRLQQEKDKQLSMLRAETERRQALEGELMAVRKKHASAEKKSTRLEDQLRKSEEAASKLRGEIEKLEHQEYERDQSMEELREALATTEAARDEASSSQRAASLHADDIAARLAWMENHASMSEDDMERMRRELQTERESRLLAEEVVNEAQRTAQSAAYAAAELAGHHNPKQRIKYVHTLREQIFHLQKDNRMLERRLAEEAVCKDERGSSLIDRLTLRSVRKLGEASAAGQQRRASSESPKRGKEDI
eukprot:scaffold4220_cov251-Pinguiococcus_pyrenoidosus.AAC.5